MSILEINFQSDNMQHLKRKFSEVGFHTEQNDDKLTIQSFCTIKFLFQTWGTCLFLEKLIIYKKNESYLGKMQFSLTNIFITLAILAALFTLTALDALKSDPKVDISFLVCAPFVLIGIISSIIFLTLRSSLKSISKASE